MCGICGLLGPAATGERLAAMTAAIVHRGPDDGDQRLYPEAQLAFGHTRLAIIAPTEEGRQPMADTTGRYVIAYNGEVYNYREVRDELAALGHRFATATDTEVIIEAYKRWGPEGLHRLRGMFAIALLDRGGAFGPEPVAGRPAGAPRDGAYLFLARDRFGIKPLYYSFAGSSFAFASELAALRAGGLVPARLDPDAVVDVLRYGAVRQPRSILADVRALQAGHWAVVVPGAGELHMQRYWDLAEGAAERAPEIARLDYAGQTAAVRAALEDSARLHLVADVPVGAFLSGGVDSSAVVALMTRIAGHPIRTFSLGFDRATEVFDERAQARVVADALGADHTEVVLTDREALDLVPAAVAALDQPSIDGTNTYLISRATSRAVKVAVSGLGGDELFAGYPHFQRLNATPSRAAVGQQALYQLYANVGGRLLRRLSRHQADAPHALETARAIYPPAELARLLQPEWRGRIGGAATAAPGVALGRINQMSYLECRGYLLDTLLRDGDVMSMAHGLEVRPMLLDHRLAELALALPAASKLRDGRTKAILVDAVRDLLPDEVFRRDKHGFELPFGSWLNGPLRQRYVEAMNGPLAGRLLSDAARRVFVQRARADGLSFRDWPFFVLTTWAEAIGASLADEESAPLVA